MPVILPVVCTKQKTKRCIIFLPVNFSVSFLLVIIHTISLAILLYILLQQQAMADSMKIINFLISDGLNLNMLYDSEGVKN